MPYFRVVFKLPTLAGEIAFQNKAAVYAILFRPPLEHSPPWPPIPGMWRANRRHRSAPYLGSEPAAPSAHSLRGAGRRRSSDGTSWIACRPGFFLPVRVLSRPFRKLFLQNLQDAFDAGLRFFGNLAGLAEPTAFAPGSTNSGGSNGSSMPSRRRPEQVLAYLGRYTHRVAIAKSRLVSLSDGRSASLGRTIVRTARPR